MQNLLSIRDKAEWESLSTYINAVVALFPDNGKLQAAWKALKDNADAFDGLSEAFFDELRAATNKHKEEHGKTQNSKV